MGYPTIFHMIRVGSPYNSVVNMQIFFGKKPSWTLGSPSWTLSSLTFCHKENGGGVCWDGTFDNQPHIHHMGISKNRGKTPKMDGL